MNFFFINVFDNKLRSLSYPIFLANIYFCIFLCEDQIPQWLLSGLFFALNPLQLDITSAHYKYIPKNTSLPVYTIYSVLDVIHKGHINCFFINIISVIGGWCLPMLFLGDRGSITKWSLHKSTNYSMQCSKPDPSTHLTAYNFGGILIYIQLPCRSDILSLFYWIL